MAIDAAGASGVPGALTDDIAQLGERRLGVLAAVIGCLALNAVLSGLWLATAPSHHPPFEVVFAALGLTATLAAALGMIWQHHRTSVALRRAHAAQLEALAIRDEISGLHSFRYVRERMRAQMAEAKCHDRCTLVLIDLDNFKEVNDRYGHLVGDAVLAAVGDSIKATLPPVAMAARYGGDEFAIVLPSHSRDDAVRLADELRAKIAAASRAVTSGNDHGGVDACFGVAVYPDDATDLDALVVKAHRALDDAKLRNSDSAGRKDERHAQEVFFAIGDAMGKSLDPQDLIMNLVNAVGTSLDLDSCTLWLTADNLLAPRAWFLRDRAVVQAFAEIYNVEPLTTDEARRYALLGDNAVYTDAVLESDALPPRYRTLVDPHTWMITVPLPASREGAITMTGVHSRIAPPSLSLARALARLVASALQNADIYARAVRQHEQLSSLAGISGLLFEDGSFEERLGAVVRRIAEITGTDMLTLDTRDPTGERPFLREFYLREGSVRDFDESLRAAWLAVRPQITDESVAAFIAEIKEPIVLDDPPNQVPEIYRAVVLKSGTRSAVVVPAVWQGELKGLMHFASVRSNAFDAQDVAVMKSIAAQLAPALQVAALGAEIEHSYEELKAAHTQALLRLAYAAEARDPYTECHLTRIKAISQAIASRIGIEGEELEAIGYGAIVHDLGKLRIPDSILCNPGSLSDEEWATMKRHPEWGAEIIGENSFYDVARQVALSHHERWDGSGYPRGLAGEEIPVAARIVAVADVYDALTSTRPYKKAWPVERALVELMRMRGKTLCPRSVDVFMQLWNEGAIAAIDAETLDESLEAEFRSLFAA